MIQRIKAIDPANAEGATKILMDGIAAELGRVPNLLRTMAQSPAALEGYLGLSGALENGALDTALREQIALVVAGANGCDYCASAHSLLARTAGVDADEAARNLRGESGSARVRAVLQFARVLVAKRARVSDADLVAIRSAGFSEGQIVEILAHVALNLFTNYFNHLARTEIDFPAVDTSGLSVAA